MNIEIGKVLPISYEIGKTFQTKISKFQSECIVNQIIDYLDGFYDRANATWTGDSEVVQSGLFNTNRGEIYWASVIELLATMKLRTRVESDPSPRPGLGLGLGLDNFANRVFCKPWYRHLSIPRCIRKQ